ncbi:MAG: hypothetical protein QXW97_03640 [Candidatus Pacearchaeota archaeon]
MHNLKIEEKIKEKIIEERIGFPKDFKGDPEIKIDKLSEGIIFVDLSKKIANHFETIDISQKILDKLLKYSGLNDRKKSYVMNFDILKNYDDMLNPKLESYSKNREIYVKLCKRLNIIYKADITSKFEDNEVKKFEFCYEIPLITAHNFFLKTNKKFDKIEVLRSPIVISEKAENTVEKYSSLSLEVLNILLEPYNTERIRIEISKKNKEIRPISESEFMNIYNRRLYEQRSFVLSLTKVFLLEEKKQKNSLEFTSDDIIALRTDEENYKEVNKGIFSIRKKGLKTTVEYFKSPCFNFENFLKGYF